MMLAAGSTFAQVTVSEPEFVNSYCILTSDSTLAILPKESGSIQKHENKAKKWTKIIGGAADVVGAVGMVGARPCRRCRRWSDWCCRNGYSV